MGLDLYKIISIKTCLNPIIYILFLTACSSGDSYSSASHVLARVNGDEITASQLNSELQKIKISDQFQASQKALTVLIDRQLLVQESLKLNIDRIPEVQEAVAAAKAQIYAQAYISTKLAKLVPPNAYELKQFINQNSQYFSHRKVFHTIDVMYENSPKISNLNWLETEAHSLDALLRILNEKGITFQVTNNQFSTDELPQVLFEKLTKVKVGDLLFTHSDDKVIVKSISLIETFPQPVHHMEQIAARMLSEQQKQDFIVKEINRLKSLAKVEFISTNLIPK